MSDYEIPQGKCLSDKILIKMLPMKDKTSGGIVLLQDNSNLVEAVVILVSAEVKSIQQFDKLLVPNGAGTEQEIDGIKYKFIRESDPFYIIE